MAINGLVPARFLTLIAHLVLTIVLYWSMNANINACLPVPYYPNQYQSSYNTINVQLIIGVSVAIGLMAFELVGFFAGISMFMPSQGLISTLAHISGAVTLILFLFGSWCANYYWYIFGFCVAPPFVTECMTWIGVLAIKKTF